MPDTPAPTPDSLIDFLPWLPARHSGAGRGWTAGVQRCFVAELARHGSVRRAAAAVGRSKQSAYRLRDRAGAEAFAVAWDMAAERGVAATMAAAIPRARDGEWVPVYRRGVQVGMRKRHHDQLAIAVLGAYRRRGPVAGGEPGFGAGGAVGGAGDLDEQRYRLERWAADLRRRELDLLERVAGRPLAADTAEAHALLARAIADEDRADRLAAARATERARRARLRAAARARLAGPAVRAL